MCLVPVCCVNCKQRWINSPGTCTCLFISILRIYPVISCSQIITSLRMSGGCLESHDEREHHLPSVFAFGFHLKLMFRISSYDLNETNDDKMSGIPTSTG
eukprot:888757_1